MGSRCLLKPSMTVVKSRVSFRSLSGRQHQRTLPHLKEIGLAKRLERHSLSPATLTRCTSNSALRRVCRCSRYIRTISECKDTLSGSHGTRLEKSMACTLVHHECVTCRSSV